MIYALINVATYTWTRFAMRFGSMVRGPVRLFTSVRDTKAIWALKALFPDTRMNTVNDTTAN